MKDKNTSTTKKNKNTKNNDVLLWAAFGASAAVAASLIYFLHLVGPLKILAWLVWLVIALGIVFFTEKGKALFEFIKEAKVELKKVVWPSRQETIQTTSIVMLMVGVTGFMLWGVDSLMMWIIGKITQLG